MARYSVFPSRDVQFYIHTLLLWIALTDLTGTGRVGSSTAAALLKAQPELNITLAGRTEGRAKDAKAARPLLKDCSYEYLDIEKPETLTKALTKQKYDLVIHTAGPFQRREKCTVLEAAIEVSCAFASSVCPPSRRSLSMMM